MSFKFKHLLTSIFLFYTSHSIADLAKIKDIDFGTIAIGDNSEVSRLTVTRQGQIYRTKNLYVIEGGAPGEIEVTNYLPGTTLYLSATPSTTTLAATGILANFNMTAVDIAPSVFIGNSGVGTVTVGGTIESTGDDKVYYDAEYNSSISIMVNF